MLRPHPALAVLLLAAACSSPLTRAAKLGRSDEIASLLPGERRHCGAALNAAAAGDQEAGLKALLDGGCGVDDKDSDGFTALMTAAARGHDGCVRLLLERKADAELRSWNERTPVELARRARQTDTVKLIEGFVAVPPPAAVEEVLAGRLARAPGEYMGRLVLVRGLVQTVVGAQGREYGFGLAGPGADPVPLAGEKRLRVASMAIVVDDEGGRCAFIFQEGMAVPPAGRTASLRGRFLGDRLRAAAAAGSSSLAPGVYLEAAGD